MHRIEVSPFAAPNEPVSLENLYNVKGYPVSIAAVLVPEPIIREFCVEIDRRAPGVHAAITRVLHCAAVERARAWKSVSFDFGRELIKFL